MVIMDQSRSNAVLLWLLCSTAIPFLWVMQLLQALFGSAERSHAMAFAIDECGNALFGGDPHFSISHRVGRAVVAGKRWAKIVEPCIDFFFGAGHCLNAEK